MSFAGWRRAVKPLSAPRSRAPLGGHDEWNESERCREPLRIGWTPSEMSARMRCRGVLRSQETSHEGYETTVIGRGSAIGLKIPTERVSA